ncbi:MAG: hypothetical protein GY765_29285, partial [bacterium]|nr:hypothetical protein [bacterium]
LQTVLNFKAFSLDGVSAITLVEAQHEGRLQLSSSQGLEMKMSYIRVKKDENGKPLVGFNFRLIQETPIGDNEQDTRSKTLIESQVSISDYGYYVAGVSKIGKNGDSLILVMNPVIK